MSLIPTKHSSGLSFKLAIAKLTLGVPNIMVSYSNT